MSDEQKKTLLDDLKKMEEAKKKRILAKILNQIKEDAEEIIRLKLSYDIYMEELGVSQKEAKSIIDWINSLIKISDNDKEELKEEIRDELKEENKKIEKKIEDSPMWFGGQTLASKGAVNTLEYSPSSYTVSGGTLAN